MSAPENASAPENSDPAAIVAAFEARARRFETPCGDGNLVWHSWGSGPPVFLSHGSHGSWTHWIRSIDALAATRTVWAVDLPGFGDSALPAREDHETISAALAEGLTTLVGPDLPVDAVAFSFSGVVLTHLAVLHPTLLRRIILVDTGGLGTPAGELDLVRVRGLEGAERDAATRRNLLGLMLLYPESVDALAIYLQDKNGFRGRLTPRPLVQPHRLLTILPDVPVQVDAIWSEYDRPHPDASVQEAALRSVRPELDFRVIPDSGHWVMYERPDAFNAVLIDMLDRPLRATATIA